MAAKFYVFETTSCVAVSKKRRNVLLGFVTTLFKESK
jgi:hypothetical protein